MNDDETLDFAPRPPSPPPGGPGPGRVIDERFTLEGLAGQGGMGQVHRAWDAQTGQRVALKLIHGTPSPEALHRFHREATLLSSLRHPGLVAHVAHGATEQGQPYLVMEWLQGEELSRRLAHQPLRLPESLSLLRRAAEGLAHAHQRGIVHRDLKPTNLFLRGGRPEDVVILDFGLARRAWQAEQGVTRSHTVVGTPGYMAPEQASCHPDIPPAADIFSLGCVLYECLTGRPPFEAPHFAAALAKILFTEPVPVRTLRPELPEAVGALVDRMLVKDARHRLADAAALLEALDALEHGPRPADALVADPPRLPSFAGAEQQLVSVLLVSLPDPTASRPGSASGQDMHEALSALLVPQGGRVERLADGSLVATLVPLRGTATDQAALAARCALAFKERWPEASVALVTGLGLMAAHLPVGEAMDKAGRLLRRTEAASSASVLMDEVTAGLLGAGFQLTPSGSGAFLLRSERLGVDTSRPLLGRPTPCVGREQELALLESCFATCHEESSARAVLVTAAPGVGKSRLRHEFLRRLEHRSPAPRVLLGRGDPMHPGASHGLLGQVLRELCGVGETDDLEARRLKLARRVARHVPLARAREVAEFLGELCAIPFPDEDQPRLRAARGDPPLMGAQMGRALVTFLEAECAHAPVLLVLEDLHWSDALTVGLVDRLLRELGERPFMVLALARPEVHTLFPALWTRARQELSLNGLSRKACARLVREVLGGEVPESVVRATVEQSDGNALFLEELIRGVAEGRGDEAPGTVLAVLQARLMRMEAGARQTLLVASIFGRAFWSSGVAALLGRPAGDALVETHLGLLMREEVIEPVADSRFPATAEYRFRHALVRDAAYGLLSEPHRTLGHQLAGAWLERMGEPDAQELALHSQLGQRPERAAVLYTQAADRLFEHNDLQGTKRCVEAALACGVSGEALPRLQALQALVSLWGEQTPRTLELGLPVLEKLPPGGRHACWLLGGLILGATIGGQTGQARALGERLLGTEPVPEAVALYIEALANMSSTFFWSGELRRMEQMLERARQVGPTDRERPLMVRGYLHLMESQYVGLVKGGLWSALVQARASLQAFEELGVERNISLVRNVVGLLYAELGDSASAIHTLREAWAGARNHEQYLMAFQVSYYLMQALTLSPEPEHRREALELARVEPDPGLTMPVLQGMHGIFVTQTLLVHDLLDEAVAQARRTQAVMRPFPTVSGLADATLAEALRRRGLLEEARTEAEAGVAALERCGSSMYTVLIFLSLVEVCLAQGDEARAEAALRQGLAHLRELTADIPEPAARERFLTQVAVNARTLALARERWGEDVLAGLVGP